MLFGCIAGLLLVDSKYGGRRCQLLAVRAPGKLLGSGLSVSLGLGELRVWLQAFAGLGLSGLKFAVIFRAGSTAVGSQLQVASCSFSGHGQMNSYSTILRANFQTSRQPKPPQASPHSYENAREATAIMGPPLILAGLAPRSQGEVGKSWGRGMGWSLRLQGRRLTVSSRRSNRPEHAVSVPRQVGSGMCCF